MPTGAGGGRYGSGIKGKEIKEKEGVIKMDGGG